MKVFMRCLGQLFVKGRKCLGDTLDKVLVKENI